MNSFLNSLNKLNTCY